MPQEEEVTLTLIVSNGDAKAIATQVSHYANALPGVRVRENNDEEEKSSRSGRR